MTSPSVAVATAASAFLPAAAGHGWVQVLSDLHPRYGGVSAAVPSLAAALSNSGVPSAIAAFCQPYEHYTPPQLSPVGLTHWPSSRVPWWRQPGLQTDFSDAVQHADGLHLHGLWRQSSVIASRAAMASRKPYVVSAHGMLEPWALGHHRLRKQLYSLLTERRTLRNAGCLHALTPAEALAYRRYAGPHPVAIIPNGVDRPATLSSDLFLQEFPSLQGKRILLFLARLHVKKGVDLLVRSFLRIAAQHPDAALVIAGPDEEGMRAYLESLTVDHPESVVFTGMLDTSMKWSALAAASCFALPSHSEGFSMGVLEAMAAGKPVLLTPECNMPQVAENGAGWLVSPDVDELTDALRFILTRSDEQNSTVGNNGARLVRRDYTWASVAQRMAQVYRWLLGGPLPTSCEVIQ